MARIRVRQLKAQAAYTMANANQAIDKLESEVSEKLDQAGELMAKLDSIATDLKSLTVLVAMMANAVAEYFDDDKEAEKEL